MYVGIRSDVMLLNLNTFFDYLSKHTYTHTHTHIHVHILIQHPQHRYTGGEVHKHQSLTMNDNNITF